MLPKSAMKKEKIIGKRVNYRERHWFRDNEINPLGTTTFFTLKDICYTGSLFLFRVYSTISPPIPSPFQPPYCKLAQQNKDKDLETGITAANSKNRWEQRQREPGQE